MPKAKSNEKAHRKTKKRRRANRSTGLGSQRTQKEKTAQSPTKEQALRTRPKIYFSDIPKYYDTGLLSGGKVERYWNLTEIIPYFKKFRKGPLSLPKEFRYWDHLKMMEKFSLKGWEFGNWLSQEDRLNYVCACSIALFDLKNILGFTYPQMGLNGKLGITLGSRGIPKSLAHFSPAEWIINITRYKDYGNARGKHRLPVPDNPKLKSFLYTGGVGAFGHEYGHALDYWIGGYFDQDPEHFSLSKGRSITRTVDKAQLKRKTPRGIMEKILMTIIWEDYDKKVLTDYYYKLNNNSQGEYWIRRNELFARAFEQWISFEMEKRGQINSFLHFNKYGGIAYMDKRLLRDVSPIFNSLIRSIRLMLRKL